MIYSDNRNTFTTSQTSQPDVLNLFSIFIEICNSARCSTEVELSNSFLSFISNWLVNDNTFVCIKLKISTQSLMIEGKNYCNYIKWKTNDIKQESPFLSSQFRRWNCWEYSINRRVTSDWPLCLPDTVHGSQSVVPHVRSSLLAPLHLGNAPCLRFWGHWDTEYNSLRLAAGLPPHVLAHGCVLQDSRQRAAVHLVEVHEVLQARELGPGSVKREGVTSVMRHLTIKCLRQETSDQSILEKKDTLQCNTWVMRHITI